MQRALTALLSICVLIQISCLDAPHDNIYDPANPNKASLSLMCYELGSYSLAGAVVNLVHDNEIVASDTTDDQGIAVFDEIDPGIYYLRGTAPYFGAVEYGPESLWAGVQNTDYRVEFLTLDFDGDPTGTASPYRFLAVNGIWAIVDYIEDPQAHSTPHVYQGIDSSTTSYTLSLCEPEAQHFFLEAHLRVAASSQSNWQTGVVFRHQDNNNCYLLLIAPQTTYCYSVVNGQMIALRIIDRITAIDTWHTLRVERREGELSIRVSIDEAVIFTVYDGTFTGGRVGLIVSNGEGPAPATVFFDDVTLDLTHTHVE